MTPKNRVVHRQRGRPSCGCMRKPSRSALLALVLIPMSGCVLRQDASMQPQPARTAGGAPPRTEAPLLGADDLHARIAAWDDMRAVTREDIEAIVRRLDRAIEAWQRGDGGKERAPRAVVGSRSRRSRRDSSPSRATTPQHRPEAGR